MEPARRASSRYPSSQGRRNIFTFFNGQPTSAFRRAMCQWSPTKRAFTKRTIQSAVAPLSTRHLGSPGTRRPSSPRSMQPMRSGCAHTRQNGRRAAASAFSIHLQICWLIRRPMKQRQSSCAKRSALRSRIRKQLSCYAPMIIQSAQSGSFSIPITTRLTIVTTSRW